MLLTHIVVERAARRSKPYELRDGKGLFLRVTPSGTKGWRYRYEWKGKEQSLVLGHQPISILTQKMRSKFGEFGFDLIDPVHAICIEPAGGCQGLQNCQRCLEMPTPARWIQRAQAPAWNH